MSPGYFSLKELQEARCPLGLPIERDLYFEPKILNALMEMYTIQPVDQTKPEAHSDTPDEAIG